MLWFHCTNVLSHGYLSQKDLEEWYVNHVARCSVRIMLYSWDLRFMEFPMDNTRNFGHEHLSQRERKEGSRVRKAGCLRGNRNLISLLQ